MLTGSQRALSGVRVLDFSQVMAGPFCTMLLGDMGADVIKVEPPEGDTSRQMGIRHDPRLERESPSYWAVNRNKRGIAVNLKDPRGVEICRRLVGRADILVENFRPGTMDRLGLGYDHVRPRHPGLIYASVSGYGQTGPLAHRGGFDLVAQGESGIMSVTGSPGGPPVKCGVPVCDLGAGLFLTYAILCAYIHRSRTGEGQRVETSLLEAGIALSVWEATEYFTTGSPPQPTGSAHRMTAPYQAVRCEDGYLTIGAANQRTWERLCQVLGVPDLVARPEFATDADRVAHRDALAAAVESITLRRPRAHWLRVLEEAGVPCGPIHTYPEVFAHPHVQARAMLQEIEHPAGGRIRQVGPAVKCSGTPAALRGPAPLLGQHTAEVLEELGYARAAIDALAGEGVIRLCPSPSR
ncbi:MAG: CoA transferase [Armatimonadetes bacterium]|nr:CoA transferase [Armatimonadota bacterium]